MEDKEGRSGAFWATIALSAVLCGGALALVAGYFIGHFGNPKDKTVTVDASHQGLGATPPAVLPAFTADQLNSAPADDWLTNGGSLSNDRFSLLDQINTTNVSQLRGTWMTHLNGSGTATKYSAEGQPLEYNGTIYVPTGADDVFAVDASTGRIRWEYRANLPDSLASVVCCGWDNRGVAIGGGMIYSGQLDGSLVALDQNTGNVVWKSQLAEPAQGYTITAAPLYYDGRVFVGPSGAEYGTRGRMDAYDARTGRLLWRFYTIPGPGQPGHDTWPSNNDEWQHGGATTWNTPSVDPSLGLLYFSTSNAGDDFDGSQRPGDNLYSSSILALDVNTGKLRWAYQQVHHDIWDFDSPSPTVLIDAKIHGKEVPGIAQPSKNGYVFFLNRENGQPVFPIKETPVPQDSYQQTARTQPIPEMPPFSPTTVTPSLLRAVQGVIATQVPRGTTPPRVVAGSIYGGWATSDSTITASAPSAAGGDNWPPSSYDPQTQMYYVCSQSGAQAFTLPPAQQRFSAGATYTGAGLSGINGFNSPGFLTAYDMSTGRIVWQKQFGDACYSGAVSTAGGVVFVGRNRGELQAFNARTGKLLWHFQTGAGANSTVASFARNGRQYLAFLAGGNALNGSAHGDNLWEFSLDGNLGPAPAPGTGTAITHAGDRAPTTTRSDTSQSQSRPTTQATRSTGAGNATAGESVFSDNCSVCHGAMGTGGNGGPDLTSIPSARQVPVVVRQVTNGGGGMPAFGGQLTDQQIQDVAAFVTQTITNR